MKLTIDKLKKEAKLFCEQESKINHKDLFGITDGKAIGTYIEHRFKEHLKDKYEITIGSSAKGVDLPDPDINTDIKVTSITNPQSSSPFKNIEQKIYGLGYNLLIFIYKKNDINNKCYIGFKHCIFLESEKSGDYTLTKILRKMIELNAKESDIFEILNDNNFPGNEKTLKKLAKKILINPPKQGYLTISNAFQWRLKYNKIIRLKDNLEEVFTNEKYNEKELIDYQTPLFFTDKICHYLKNDLKINPTVIIEPTCGIGNFLNSASKFFPNKELYGIEIDENKLNKVERSISNINLINEDIFKFKFDMINKKDQYLIIGHPPSMSDWELFQITSNKVNSNDKNNIPDAITEISNQNISEKIMLKIINEFKNTKTTIAFLCTRNVSKNIFKKLIENKIPYSFVKQLDFDSSKIFKIEQDYNLFIIQFGGVPLSNNTCEVLDFLNPEKKLYKLSFETNNIDSDINEIVDIDGNCKPIWQSGVKHDCA